MHQQCCQIGDQIVKNGVLVVSGVSLESESAPKYEKETPLGPRGPVFEWNVGEQIAT